MIRDEIFLGRVSDGVYRRISIPLSNFTNKNLVDHYTECIRLATENKISTKNAFSLHLIDYMADMFNKKDTTDFQLASSTIDASAKIYSCRVDIIHSDLYKLLTGLGRGWNKNDNSENDDNDVMEGGDYEGIMGENKKIDREAKKKKVKKGKTIEQNLKNITINKQEQFNTLDPVMAKIVNDFNVGSLGGILLNRLRMHSDLAELIVEPTSINQIRSRYEKHVKGEVDVTELNKINLNDKRIKETFSDLKFGEYIEPEKFVNSAEDLRFNLDAEYEDPDEMRHDDGGEGDLADDDGAGRDAFACVSIDDVDNDDAMPAKMEGTIIATESVQALLMDHTIASIKNGTMDSLLQAIGNDQSEYSYFKTDFLRLWAGPAHWKLKPRIDSNAASNKSSTVKKAKKIEFTLDFKFEEMEAQIRSKFNITKAATVVTKSTLMKHTDKKNTFPEDTKYDRENLLHKFTMPDCLFGKNEKIEAADVDVDNYDYDNEADRLDYCAPAAQTSREGDLDNDVDGGDNSYDDVLDFNLTASTTIQLGDVGGDNRQFAPMEAVFEEEEEGASGAEAGEILDGDNLIAPPRKIAKVDIDYERVSKRIDVKLLKHTMWNLIRRNNSNNNNSNCNTNCDNNSFGLNNAVTPLRGETALQHDDPNNIGSNQTGNSNSNNSTDDNNVRFIDLVNQLRPRLTSPTRENLSIHIAFVCLLHIANERNLKLSNTDDHQDIIIEITRRTVANNNKISKATINTK